MWKIHRYYLREVATNASMTFLVLFGIVLISLVYRGLERAAGLGLLTAAQTTVFWAADTIPHLLSLSLLLATVLVSARASQDREITALRSAGVSPRVALAPSLLVGITFSVLGSIALHYVIPMAHYNKYRVGGEVIRELVLQTGLRGDRFQLPNGDFVMTWDRKEGDRYFDVFIRVERQSDSVSWGGIPVGLLRADSAELKINTRTERIALDLYGLRQPGQDRKIGFVSPSVDIRSLTEGRRRQENDRDLTSDQLLGEVYRDVHPNPTAAYYTVYKRGCFALMPFLFAPIGFCIGVFSRERGRVLALTFAMIPALVFYLGDFVGVKLVQATDQAWLAWFPAILMVLFGTPFCWRLLRF